MKNMKRLLMAGTAIFVSSAGFAQDQDSSENTTEEKEDVLETIVVTAQKRAQGLEEVPISLAAVSGELISKASMDSLQDLSASVPSLIVTKSGITSEIGIRGVYSGANKGFEQSVGMFVDGVYYGRDQLTRLPLLDLERVEVLRGPQPTLFGNNAIAGAVNIITARPTEEFEGAVTALYEFEQDEMQFTGVLSGPFSDSISGRLTASYRDLGGIFYNDTLDRREAAVEETYLRGQLAYDNHSALDVLFKVEFSQFDSIGRDIENYGPVGNFSAVYAGPLAVETDLDYNREDNGSNSLNDAFVLALNANLDLGGDYILTSTTGFIDYNTTELIDVDYTGVSLLDGTNQSEDFQQFSQELRVTSPGGERVDFIAGLYFQSQDLTVTDSVKFNPFFLATPFAAIGDTTNERFYEQDAETYAAFAQVTLNATDRLSITAGARYGHNKKSGSREVSFTAGALNTGFSTPSPVPIYNSLADLTFAVLNIEEHAISGNRSEDDFDPIVNVQYEASDSINLFASFSKGSKAGGFDLRGNSLPTSVTVAVPATFEFEGESAENFEIGLKANWDRASFNLSVFDSTYDNLQQAIFDGTLNFNVQNASQASIRGIEADGRALIAPGLILRGSLAYLDFEFGEFDTAQCYFGQTPGANGLCDITGQSPARTPELTGNLALDYTTDLTDDLELDMNLNMDYSSSYLAALNLDPNTKQDAYAVFDARVSIGEIDKGWRLSLIANNLFNQRVMLVSTALPLSTTFTGGGGTAYYGLFDRPRNIALRAEFRF